jgi:hypothetical protein
MMSLRTPPAASGVTGSLRTRLAGLGLMSIALGPVAVIVTAIVLTALAVVDLANQMVANVGAVATIVENRISPEIAAIDSAFARLGAPISQLENQIDAALSAVEKVGNIQIAAGQWGRTPSVHITVPPNDLPIASVPQTNVNAGSLGGIVSGVEKGVDKAVDTVGSIKAGEVFNETTPSVPIPPGPIVVPMEPLQQALAPLGPGGAVGKAIKAAESKVGTAIAELAKLQQPVQALRDGVAGVLAPLQAALGPMVSAIVMVVVALAAQVLVCGVSMVRLLLTHPAEFARALLTHGPIGLIGYCYRAMLLSGFAIALAREPSSTHEHIIDGLRERARRLQSEIATVRAEHAGAT